MEDTPSKPRTAERPTLLGGGNGNTSVGDITSTSIVPQQSGATMLLRSTTKANNNNNAPSGQGGEEEEDPNRRDIYTMQCQPRNEELQSSVHNSCAAIYPLQEELKGLMVDWQSRWSSWCDDNAKQVKSFDEELTYYAKKAYAETELDESYACHLKSEWLEAYLKRVKAIQKAAEAEKQQQEEKEAAAKARRFEGLSEEEAEMLRNEMAALEDEERDNQPPLSPNSAKKAIASNMRRISFGGLHDDLARLFFGPIKRVNVTNNVSEVNETLFPFDGHELVEHTMTTHDNGQADPLNLLRAEFAKSLAVVAANEAQLFKMNEERDSLIAQERVSEAEVKTKEMVDHFTDTLHIVFSRFKQAIVAGVDVQEFTDHVLNTARGTEEKAGDAKKEADETRQKSQQDLANLRELIKKNRETARQQLLLFETRREDSNNKLKQNTMNQQGSWAIIMNELQRLKELCVEREALIGDRMLATEKEQERTQLNAEIEAVCGAREDDLLAVLDNARQALEYVGSVENLSATVQSSVKEKAFPEKLLKYQIEEALRFNDVYKRYVLFAGRALFLKQQRLENIRRLVRATEFQIQSAAETLDADLPVYRAQLVKFKGTEDLLKTESTLLSDQMAKESGYWDEVEHFLEQQSVAIEAPPALAVQELQRDLMKNHVEAVDVLASTEQKLLDGEKAHVRRIHNACVAAKEVIQEKHRHRSMMQSAGSISGTSPSPLSPSSTSAKMQHQQQQQQQQVSPTPIKKEDDAAGNVSAAEPAMIAAAGTPTDAAAQQLQYN